MVKPHRDTISVHDCQILAHYQFEADQYIITLESKEIADSTRPGQFVHLSVSGMLAMRRPISVMSVDIENGTFDLLYKIVGEGTKQLAERKISVKQLRDSYPNYFISKNKIKLTPEINVDEILFKLEEKYKNELDRDAIAAKLGITLRQLDVLNGMAEGLSNREICTKMGVAESTIKSHGKVLFQILNVKNRTACILEAKRLNLIPEIQTGEVQKFYQVIIDVV